MSNGCGCLSKQLVDNDDEEEEEGGAQRKGKHKKKEKVVDDAMMTIARPRCFILFRDGN